MADPSGRRLQTEPMTVYSRTDPHPRSKNTANAEKQMLRMACCLLSQILDAYIPEADNGAVTQKADMT